MKLLIKRTKETLHRLRRLFSLLLLLLLFFPPCPAHGQMQSVQQNSATHAVQLPLSGRTGNASVTVEESGTPPPGSSVDTVKIKVEISAPYSGSVPGADLPNGSIRLTLSEALRRGLATNLGLVDADAASQQMRAQRNQARSALLPSISASFSETVEKVNLAAEGFSASEFGGAIASLFPSTVGPFHFYDAHLSFSHDLLDLTASHNLHSAEHSATATVLEARQAREDVLLAVAGTYLQLLASSSLVEEQRAEVRYAEASYKQAKAQEEAGNKAPIDANRSLVEVQTEQQRLRSQLGDLAKQKNRLARMIGLPLGCEIETAEELVPLVLAAPPLKQAIREAWAQRQDLRAAESQLRAADEARRAAAAERLPSASISGQYGLEGVNPNRGLAVYQATASLNIPVFQGGRISADIAQADAVVRQRRAELADQRGAVEFAVRNAWIDLGIAAEQVVTAGSNRKLALATLEQSQDRFSVGVADSVEVVNSQEALAAADHDYVSSLFSQYLARITLAHAMGEAESELSNLFKRN